MPRDYWADFVQHAVSILKIPGLYSLLMILNTKARNSIHGGLYMKSREAVEYISN